MTPLAFPLGPSELLIILAIVLLLFGGSRLAGLGKSTGRALKEFKEETKGLKAGETPPTDAHGSTAAAPLPPQSLVQPQSYSQPQDVPGQVPGTGSYDQRPIGEPYVQPQDGVTGPADHIRRDS